MIAVTGASGFIGSEVLRVAFRRNLTALPLSRQPGEVPLTGQAPRIIGDLGAGPIDPTVLDGCTAVIHTAARAHRLGEHGAAALTSYRKVNVAGTRALIDAMAHARVRRLIYVSSIKALAERSRAAPLVPGDVPAPEDPYGISKCEAESLVRAAHAAGRIQAVIIRPVLVHGPGAKGNFERLLSAISRGRLLPFGGICNRRSMLGVENLAEALIRVATAEYPVENGPTTEVAQAPIYHLADDGVISTRRLVEVLAAALGVQPRLIGIPRWLAVGGAALLGKGAMARRLFDDLEVDDKAFRQDFAWQPAVDFHEGLRRMALDHVRRNHQGV